MDEIVKGVCMLDTEKRGVRLRKNFDSEKENDTTYMMK